MYSIYKIQELIRLAVSGNRNGFEDIRKVENTSALQEKASCVIPSSGLKNKVMACIPFEKGRKQMKKRILSGILAATVILPTSGFASSYLADQVFGSSDVMKGQGGTQQQYDHFESKLQHAQKQLTAKEFIAFIGLLKDLTFYNLKTVDSKGNIHPDQLNKQDRAEYDLVIQKIQPYFDKLNAEEK